MDDDTRRIEAGQRLTETIVKAIEAVQEVRVEEAADGSPLCRKQFLMIAERHLDVARRYARSACGPPGERDGDDS